MSNLTATLTMNPNNNRSACLEIVGPDTFVGRVVTVGRMHGGTFASKATIREGLESLAAQEARLALGGKCPVLVWA